MQFTRLLQLSVRTMLRTPRAWAPLALAMIATIGATALAVVGEAATFAAVEQQLQGSQVSADLLGIAQSLRDRALTLVVALVPAALGMLALWLAAAAYTTQIIQEVVAPNAPLPRRRARLMPSVLAFEFGLLVLGAASIPFVHLPRSAGSLIVFLLIAAVAATLALFALTIVALLRPRPRTLFATMGFAVREAPGAFLLLALLAIGELAVSLALLGFPLFFLVAAGMPRVALVSALLVAVLGIPLLVFHQTAWSVFTLTALERRAQLRAAPAAP